QDLLSRVEGALLRREQQGGKANRLLVTVRMNLSLDLGRFHAAWEDCSRLLEAPEDEEERAGALTLGATALALASEDPTENVDRVVRMLAEVDSHAALNFLSGKLYFRRVNPLRSLAILQGLARRQGPLLAARNVALLAVHVLYRPPPDWSDQDALRFCQMFQAPSEAILSEDVSTAAKNLELLSVELWSRFRILRGLVEEGRQTEAQSAGLASQPRHEIVHALLPTVVAVAEGDARFAELPPTCEIAMALINALTCWTKDPKDEAALSKLCKALSSRRDGEWQTLPGYLLNPVDDVLQVLDRSP
ncbi:MAG: hypothetical protein KDB53_17600, partial [Planctomycetes bacterium]|nr:hypothetical protein [Planctomycetota bacterium]